MYFLEIWEHPELFSEFDFSEIDKKVKFIQELRKKNELFHKVIKELNNRIDIDFINRHTGELFYFIFNGFN